MQELTPCTVAGGKVELRGDVEAASSSSEVWRVRMQKTYRHEMAKRRLAEKRQLGNGGATVPMDGLTVVRDFGAAEHNAMCVAHHPLRRRSMCLRSCCLHDICASQSPFCVSSHAPSRRFQAYGATGMPNTSDDVRGLRTAQAEGRLGEELLDRRSKMKRDKCVDMSIGCASLRRARSVSSSVHVALVRRLMPCSGSADGWPACTPVYSSCSRSRRSRRSAQRART